MKLTNHDAKYIAESLNFKNALLNKSIEIFKNMYLCYKDMDCSILEINPLILSKQDDIVAVDAKLNFDSNALFRHPNIVEIHDFYLDKKYGTVIIILELCECK